MKPRLAAQVSYGVPRAGLPATVSFVRFASAALAVLTALRPRPQALRAVLARERLTLSIRIVDAREGRTLNHRYRDRNHATNVLSFPHAGALPPEGAPLALGDLVFAAPVIARESRAARRPVAAHYAHLTIHGVFHLLGYDHGDDAAAEAMEALEVAALAAIGIADPYAAPRSVASRPVRNR